MNFDRYKSRKQKSGHFVYPETLSYHCHVCISTKFWNYNLICANIVQGRTLMLCTVENVLVETERFHNDKDIDRVAIAIAKRCFFGETTLAAATIYGCDYATAVRDHTTDHMYQFIETLQYYY